jgi:predicted DNA binding CopG/RHH family protein
MKPRKKIPTFKDEDAEREFWGKADSTEYFDWSKAQRITLPNFRPTLRTISLRLPESMIAELKLLANQRDVPYQSLLKVFLADRINEERKVTSGEKSVASRKRAG